MIIDCISDLHGFKPILEGGDLLIIAGDFTAHDRVEELQNFGFWVNAQQYKYKILVAGNHDGLIASNPGYAKEFISSAIYLEDEEIELEGFNIWGSPWTNWFHGVNPACKAFMSSESRLEKKFARIPTETDILITHGPPNGILDSIQDYRTSQSRECGSISLRNEVLNRIKPKLHVFGHIHEWGGNTFDNTTTKFVNASVVTQYYHHRHPPTRIIL